MRALTISGIVAAAIVTSAQAPAPPAAKPTPLTEEQRFQGHVAAVRRIKAGMKNPASFTLVDAMERADGTLCLVYRATNSFNAIVPGQAIVRGGRISTSDHGGDEFNAAWNSRCNGKRGTDMVHIRQAL